MLSLGHCRHLNSYIVELLSAAKLGHCAAARQASIGQPAKRGLAMASDNNRKRVRFSEQHDVRFYERDHHTGNAWDEENEAEEPAHKVARMGEPCAPAYPAEAAASMQICSI